VSFYQRVSIANYASAGIARGGMSVGLSVRHTPVLYQNEESQRQDFFTIREPEHSKFLKISGLSRNSKGVTPSEGDL